MATQAAAKAQLATVAATTGINPVDDLRQGWRSQIEFGLNTPSLFKLLSDPDRVRSSPAARTGRAVLAARVHRLAEAGLLRVSENRAVDLIQAPGIGVIQTQLSSPTDQRDPTLPDAMYEGVLGQILLTTSTGARGNPVDAAAVSGEAEQH